MPVLIGFSSPPSCIHTSSVRQAVSTHFTLFQTLVHNKAWSHHMNAYNTHTICCVLLFQDGEQAKRCENLQSLSIHLAQSLEIGRRTSLSSQNCRKSAYFLSFQILTRHLSSPSGVRGMSAVCATLTFLATLAQGSPRVGSLRLKLRFFILMYSYSSYSCKPQAPV